jgi:transcriptional regulator with XRE-family HTH domain
MHNGAMDPHKALKAWRGDRTLLEAGRLLEIDPSYVSYLENDPRREPSITIAMRILAVTGIPVEAWEKPKSKPTAKSA